MQQTRIVFEDMAGCVPAALVALTAGDAERRCGKLNIFGHKEGQAMSTEKAVRAAMRKLPRGKPCTGASFMKRGARGAVGRTLSRLVGEGDIQCLARGVFVRPRTSRCVDAVL